MSQIRSLRFALLICEVDLVCYNSEEVSPILYVWEQKNVGSDLVKTGCLIVTQRLIYCLRSNSACIICTAANVLGVGLGVGLGVTA